MFCALTGAIAVSFFGYLLYQAYLEQSDGATEESMMANLTDAISNKKVSMAGANIAITILLCYFMGWITSAMAAVVGIGAILGLDYMGYI